MSSSISLVGSTRVKDNLSVRSCAVLSGATSILDYCSFGSSFSVRGFARLGSSLSIASGKMMLGPIKIEYNDNTNKELTFSSDASAATDKRMMKVFWKTSSTADFGGQFPQVDGSTVTTSDRRLKTSIVPLYKKLTKSFNSEQDSSFKTLTNEEKTSSSATSEEQERSLALLRQLRPVSFKYKANPESKYSHFGFIAQEVEKVLPDIIGEQQGMKIIRENDLVAILTMTIQNMDVISGQVFHSARLLNEKIDTDYEILEPKIAVLENNLASIIKKHVRSMDIYQTLNVAGTGTTDSEIFFDQQSSTTLMTNNSVITEGFSGTDSNNTTINVASEENVSLNNETAANTYLSTSNITRTITTVPRSEELKHDNTSTITSDSEVTLTESEISEIAESERKEKAAIERLAQVAEKLDLSEDNIQEFFNVILESDDEFLSDFFDDLDLTEQERTELQNLVDVLHV